MNKFGLLVVVALIIVGMVFVMSLGSAASDITESLAQIEQARAMNEMAQANQIIGRGLSDTSRALSFILVVLTLAVIALAGVVVYLVLKARTQQQPKQTWTPGPNARWGRKSMPSNVDPTNMLVQMFLMDQLQKQHPQQSTPNYTEPQLVEEQEEISW